ncbi:hypothetical protein RJ641_017209 [Dillenia turbinata]|uniref:Uncharacterized protein n=1 Tax=Dillenia turbinata TaxID=194707 RepID=A0AAN8UXP0_9MAGN
MASTKSLLLVGVLLVVVILISSEVAASQKAMKLRMLCMSTATQDMKVAMDHTQDTVAVGVVDMVDTADMDAVVASDMRADARDAAPMPLRPLMPSSRMMSRTKLLLALLQGQLRVMKN